jgi:hypothetical protein
MQNQGSNPRRRRQSARSKNGKSAAQHGQKSVMSDFAVNSLPRTVLLPLEKIKESPENLLLYGPVLTSDPKIEQLAQDYLDGDPIPPIVINKDRYIISGHRRFTAAKLAGLKEIECRFYDVPRSSPMFEQLLVSCNAQREKNFDQILKERLVKADPEEAYGRLVARQEAKRAPPGTFLVLDGTKTRKAISAAKGQMVEAALRIIEEQRAFWPRNVRSIHYSFLSYMILRNIMKKRSRYKNDRSSYLDLTDVLTRMRLTGAIPFNALTDETRTMEPWAVYNGVGDFIEHQLDGFLTGYSRDLLQSQPDFYIVLGEKLTIESSIIGVCSKYTMPYCITRGYPSIDLRHRVFQHFQQSGKRRLIILALTDFDPEGEDICSSVGLSMRDDFGIENIEVVKAALTHQQIQQRNLPPNYDVKKSSSRYKKFRDRYQSDSVYELESLPPADLAIELDLSIRSVIDIGLFNAELRQLKADAGHLEDYRANAVPTLRQALDNDSTEGGD